MLEEWWDRADPLSFPLPKDAPDTEPPRGKVNVALVERDREEFWAEARGREVSFPTHAVQWDRDEDAQRVSGHLVALSILLSAFADEHRCLQQNGVVLGGGR